MLFGLNKKQKKNTPCLEEIETYVREIKVPSNKESKQLRDKILLSHYDYRIMIVIMEKSLFCSLLEKREPRITLNIYEHNITSRLTCDDSFKV